MNLDGLWASLVLIAAVLILGGILTAMTAAGVAYLYRREFHGER